MRSETFAAEVKAKVAALRDGPHRQFEAELAAKRARWATARRAELEQQRGTLPRVTPREAFEIFIRDYLGADLTTVPVRHEDDREIRWHAANPCDTLEACRELDLPTTVVCRARYDKPVQFLLSAFDPQLRFVRNYAHLRPDQDACEEKIVRVDFDEWMSMALAEARQSFAEGNKGYGAVVTRGTEVLARAHDTASTSGDPSCHAETTAIRQAAKRTGDPNLCGCVLVSTCEPCPMCASLAVWANVTTIVYGASIEQTAAWGRSRIRIPAQEIVDRGPATVEVIGGWQRQACLELYQR